MHRRFIKVTVADSMEEAYINVDKIICITKLATGSINILLQGCDAPMPVREQFYQLEAMMDGAL